MNSFYAKTIYTGTRIVSDRYVVLNGPRIAAVSTKINGKLEGKYDVITPAFVDAHSHIGMARAGEPSDQGEVNDQSESILAVVDALDSVQMDDSALADAVEMGGGG